MSAVSDGEEYLSPDRFCWQLLDSIKTIDVRINELQWLMDHLLWEDERRRTIKDRIEHLIGTRFQLVYQFIDTVSQNRQSIFASMDPKYHDLKRAIRKPEE